MGNERLNEKGGQDARGAPHSELRVAALREVRLHLLKRFVHGQETKLPSSNQNNGHTSRSRSIEGEGGEVRMEVRGIPLCGTGIGWQLNKAYHVTEMKDT